MGKHYKIYSNTTGSNNGVASLKVTAKGRVRCIYFDLSLLGGAGVSRMSYEVSKQNTSSLAINDTPPTVLASASIDSPNAVHNARSVAIPCDIDLDSGDTIYLNTVMTGAVAPGTAVANIYLFT